MSEREYAVKVRKVALMVGSDLDDIRANRPSKRINRYRAEQVRRLFETLHNCVIGELHPDNEVQSSVLNPLVVALDCLRHRQKGLPHDKLIVLAAQTILDMVVKHYPR